MSGYLQRLFHGERAIGSSTEHYWRWPVALIFRRPPALRWWVTLHGVRDGRVRGRGPFHPAIRTFLWLGPIGIEFGWRRQAIEDRLWRRRLRKGESR